MNDSQKRGLIAVVWGQKLFTDDQIIADDGNLISVQIERPGYETEDDYLNKTNENTSPDFLNAEVTFWEGDKEVTLYGAVRVDVRSSVWRESGQITLPAFDNVMFHVVGEKDTFLTKYSRGVRALVLRPDPRLEQLYAEMILKSKSGAGGCVEFFSALETVEQGQILSRLVADRLRRKTAEVTQIYNSTRQSWDETSYICYLRSFGMRDQKQSYEALARSIPLRYFVRCAGDVQQAEALLLGQSGYLSTAPVDTELRQLQDIYISLKAEYGLKRPAVAWAGAGVRPASLPLLMFRRAAVLLVRMPRVAESVREASKSGMTDLREIFGETEIGGKVSAQKIDLRIINFVIPILTAIGRETNDSALKEQALALYDEVEAEVNRYTRRWSLQGFKLRSSFDSQALIQLCTEYCAEQRCAECPVGRLRMARLWKHIKDEDQGM